MQFGGLVAGGESGASDNPEEINLNKTDGKGPSKRQIVKSDALLLFLAQIIDANLEDWHLAFGPKNKRGKGPAEKSILSFILASEHPLVKGKTTTQSTVHDWIEEGFKIGEAEESRRIREAEKGRHEDVVIEEYKSAWCDLVVAYKERAKQNLPSNRYNTPPAELQGLVFLQKDDSAMLPRSDLKKLGDEQRSEAVARVQENKKRQRNDSVEVNDGDSAAPKVAPKQHLRPTSLNMNNELAEGRNQIVGMMKSFHEISQSKRQDDSIMRKLQEIQMYRTEKNQPGVKAEQIEIYEDLITSCLREIQELKAKVSQPQISPPLSVLTYRIQDSY